MCASQDKTTGEIDSYGAAQTQSDQPSRAPKALNKQGDADAGQNSAKDARIEGLLGRRYAEEIDNPVREGQEEKAQDQIDGSIDEEH